jgi:site-specific DNA-methyltransferase (adenine-specific)
VVLDFFAGSGTTGEAAAALGRGFVLIDDSVGAVRVASARLARFDPEVVGLDSRSAKQEASVRRRELRRAT